VSCRDPSIELELIVSLQRFADRIARHPTLQRAQLVKDFLESTEWVSPTISFRMMADGIDGGEALPYLPPSP